MKCLQCGTEGQPSAGPWVVFSAVVPSDGMPHPRPVRLLSVLGAAPAQWASYEDITFCGARCLSAWLEAAPARAKAERKPEAAEAQP